MECTFCPQVSANSRPPNDADNRSGGISRNEVLYYQAFAAAKESEEAERKIRQLREAEEMKECTFTPKIRRTAPATRKRYPPAKQLKGYAEAVERMRDAARTRREKASQLEFIPVGENYEKLRAQGVKPFAFEATKKLKKKEAFLFVDVNLSGGRKGRIGMHDGDDPRQLAENFGKAYQLDATMVNQLEQLLREQAESSTRQRARPTRTGHARGKGGYAQSSSSGAA